MLNCIRCDKEMKLDDREDDAPLGGIRFRSSDNRGSSFWDYSYKNKTVTAWLCDDCLEVLDLGGCSLRFSENKPFVPKVQKINEWDGSNDETLPESIDTDLDEINRIFEEMEDFSSQGFEDVEPASEVMIIQDEVMKMTDDEVKWMTEKLTELREVESSELLDPWLKAWLRISPKKE